jgi:tetraacyldisaccharide 4'-kinase
VELVRPDGSVVDPAALADERILAFCGIGKPRFFRQDLQRLGADVRAFLTFSDHHWYESHHLAEIARQAQEAGAGAWVTTEKDYVRLPADWRREHAVHHLRIQVEFWEERSFRKFLLGHLQSEEAA